MSNTFIEPPLPSADDPWGYKGKRCVVTGAASGMGAAVCQILSSLGAEIVGIDVQEITTEGLAETHQLDLADSAAVEALGAAIEGPIAALFNCAGIPGTAPTRTVFAVNFAGMRRLTELLIPKLAEGAAICCVGSTAAVNWNYHAPTLLPVVAAVDDDFDTTVDWFESHSDLGYPYDVSKEAVNVYTAWRGDTLAHSGRRINCVNPATTYTPASREFTKAVKSKEGGAEMIEHWPRLMARMARPSEQAWVMVFLNSPYASYVNGVSINVDAGLTSGMFVGLHHPKVAAGMFWTHPAPSGRYEFANAEEQ